MALLVCGAASGAESAPTWEAGAGIASLSLPGYRGSDHQSVTALPLPYLIYRGKRLKISREGVKAKLFDLENLSVSLSAAATLPGHHGDDPARHGMPKLLPTLEIGPSFDWRVTTADYRWCFCVPVRAVLATNFNEHQNIGWLTNPQLRVERDGSLGRWQVLSSVSAGPLWAEHRYHAYFYSVQSQYATTDRPTYTAAGGYSGTRASFFVGLHRDPWRIGLGVIGDWLAGSAMADSPLVKSRTSAIIGLGVSYRLWSSGR